MLSVPGRICPLQNRPAPSDASPSLAGCGLGKPKHLDKERPGALVEWKAQNRHVPAKISEQRTATHSVVESGDLERSPASHHPRRGEVGLDSRVQFFEEIPQVRTVGVPRVLC